MGWGIHNFKTLGSPWGSGFEYPWWPHPYAIALKNLSFFKKVWLYIHFLVLISLSVDEYCLGLHLNKTNLLYRITHFIFINIFFHIGQKWNYCKLLFLAFLLYWYFLKQLILWPFVKTRVSSIVSIQLFFLELFYTWLEGKLA